MLKPPDPRDLALALLDRSRCRVQVAAVLADRHGVAGWGWNSPGPDGLGEHAEVACLRRSNPRRLAGATLYISARRGTGRAVTARPCASCQPRLKRVGRVIYRDGKGNWRHFVSSLP